MKGWAASELQYADLGDTRRNKRLVRLVEDLAAQPNASVPQASGDLAGTQAAYNFWSSPYIKAEAIREAHQKSTIERIKQHSIESQRWLTALDATQILISQETVVVTVADPEADIYDLLVLPRCPNSHLLIRATHNRRVKRNAEAEQVERLHQVMQQTPACGQLTLELRRHPEREARCATLTVRTTTLELQPPQTHPERERLEPVSLQVILAVEDNPPPRVEPVCWLLLTTLAVSCFEDVVQLLRWYSYRWLIERYHFVLKSGCRLEQLQLETGERIQRALATYTIVAWRLLWITYLARYHPDTPADTVLASHEWQALYCTIHKTPLPPPSPPSLRTCVRWIAQLGGFLGRKHDGEPGVKTIWQGLRRLHDIAQTWMLVSSTTSTCVKSSFVKKDVTNA